MTDYTLTEHSDGTVEVEVLTAAAGEAVRVALLDAAASPRAVRTVTHRARPGYRVTRALAVAAGLFPSEEPAVEPVAEVEAPAPKKAPAKKAAPKKAPEKSDVVEEVAPVVEEVPASTETTDAGDNNGE
jgi:hypothetical protein